MHIKRFRGATLKEALREVKESFGEDAVIISTKNVKGLSEVVAAIDFNVEEIESSLNPAAGLKKSLVSMKRELDELKLIFSRAIGDKARQEVAELGGSAYHVYEELLKSGIHEKLSRRLVKLAARATSDGPDEIKRRCLEVIMEKTKVHNPFKDKDGPKVIALVGPSGSGKSTTIAKIAGGLKEKYDARVSLMSLPDKRAGAASSLTKCAKEFDMSLERPETRDELSRALWKSREADVVLIDTPGINPSDVKAINRVGKMLKTGLPVETGLVLNVTSCDESQADACKGFAAMDPDYLAFTRIDEAKHYGTILNASARLDRPVAFLCDGQDIPGDIKTPSSAFLGSLVLKLNEGRA